MDKVQGLWRKKEGAYLFSHKELAKVFRAKMLSGIKEAGLTLPMNYPEKWMVDCKQVGSGNKAFIYLGRYLYKGVIQKDILSCRNGNVTFRYKDSKTNHFKTRILPGADFIRLVLQHVLPRRFRRTRDYGLLHSNSKSIIKRLHYLLKFNVNRWLPQAKPRPTISCSCCGGVMKIIQTRLERISWLSTSTAPIAGVIH